MKKSVIYAIICSLLLLSGCSNPAPTPPGQVELVVSAAASLQDALGEIQTSYQKTHPELKINFNYGSSGSLQQQIEQGAPVDLFISAGGRQMDQLDKKGLLQSKSRVNLLSNSLVLITSKDNKKITSLQSLITSQNVKLSLGTPETVPAGQYAKEALINLKLWDVLEPQIVPAKDVRQVLTYVETGNVDAGLVYSSDALSSNKVKIIAEIPSASHSPILYPAAIIKSSKESTAAQAFLEYLQTEAARKVFDHYGFKQP